MPKKKEFEDSVEATEFMETLNEMLNDPRLEDWANATDDNYGQTTSQALACSRAPFADFMNQMFDDTL